MRGADVLTRRRQAAERLFTAQILDLWSIAHRSPRLARLFLALPSCAIAGFANSLVTSALWVRDGPVVRIETSITNFDPQVPPGLVCTCCMQCACACVGGESMALRLAWRVPRCMSVTYGAKTLSATQF